MKVGGNLSWFYTDISVESPKVKKTSIFFQNELLVAITRQKYILDIGGTQSIISNNGSVNYYSHIPRPYRALSGFSPCIRHAVGPKSWMIFFLRGDRLVKHSRGGPSGFSWMRTTPSPSMI